jgi:hypothetical protein
LENDQVIKTEEQVRADVRRAFMKRKPEPAPQEPPASLDDEIPGVPGFSTWRGVYLFVLGAFLCMVAALAIFSRLYS